MNVNKPAIVVATYNRAHSFERLLGMLDRANYPDHDVQLVISIDGGGGDDVKQLADAFEWKHGSKEVIYHECNLGLREHILRCGDLTEKYGSIIMLEDDLGVSRFFYEYTLQALAQFSGNEDVAGISLYKHLINVNCGSRFEPMDNGLGYFYMQFPQSWGQVWTDKQWISFRKWYASEVNRSKPLDVPKYVAGWPESSWLKYYTRYVIDQDKYFVYPMKSLTTNFSDAGTHVTKQNNTYQVSLAEYCPLMVSGQTEVVVRYDAYFEMLECSLRILSNKSHEESIVVDLYGIRDLTLYSDDQLILTVRPCRESIQSYGLRLKSREMNVLLNVPGEEICLTKCNHVESQKESDAIEREFFYDKKWIGLKGLLRLLLNLGINRVFRRS